MQDKIPSKCVNIQKVFQNLEPIKLIPMLHYPKARSIRNFHSANIKRSTQSKILRGDSIGIKTLEAVFESEWP